MYVPGVGGGVSLKVFGCLLCAVWFVLGLNRLVVGEG